MLRASGSAYKICDSTERECHESSKRKAGRMHTIDGGDTERRLYERMFLSSILCSGADAVWLRMRSGSVVLCRLSSVLYLLFLFSDAVETTSARFRAVMAFIEWFLRST